ncbi:MAG TPA: hypothetical protein VF193_00895 [Steroidobacter sp.]
MSVATLQKRLLAEVGRLLKRYGFKEKPVDNAFRLPKAFGWASIHLVFVKHPPIDFDVSVNVAIRIDRVQEAIIDRNDPLIGNLPLKTSATIGVERAT